MADMANNATCGTLTPQGWWWNDKGTTYQARPLSDAGLLLTEALDAATRIMRTAGSRAAAEPRKAAVILRNAEERAELRLGVILSPLTTDTCIVRAIIGGLIGRAAFLARQQTETVEAPC